MTWFRGRNTYIVIIALVVLGVISPLTASAEQLKVVFDKKIYDRDDVVTMLITGYSTPASIAVEVHSPSGQLVWIDEEDNVTSPSLDLSFKLPGVPDGQYTAYVAVNGKEPTTWSFTVRRPTFRMTLLTPMPIEVNTSEPAVVEFSVKNIGADGSFYVRVKGPSGSVKSFGPYLMPFNQSGSYQVVVRAPASPGNYTYRIEIYNAKYNTVDDYRDITLIVKAPPAVAPPTTTTPAPVPPISIAPAPPATTTKPPTTTATTPAATLPATTTTTIPGAKVAFVANIADYVTANGVIKQTIKIVVPQLRAEILLPSGATVYSPTGQPVKITGIVIAEAINPPAPKTPSAKLAGPVIDIKPRGIDKAYFDKPVSITIPYDPTSVPPGYRVSLAYYNEELGKWVPVPTVRVDPVMGVVTGVTKHFTLFAAVAYRAVTPVTTTVTQTVTKPLTSTTTTTTTVPVTLTKTVTATAQATVTKTVRQTSTIVQTVTTTMASVTTSTKTVTITATPVTVTVTATKTSVSTATTTLAKTVTSTKQIVKTPAWAYGAAALAIILAIIAIALAFLAKRRPSGQAA